MSGCYLVVKDGVGARGQGVEGRATVDGGGAPAAARGGGGAGTAEFDLKEGASECVLAWEVVQDYTGARVRRVRVSVPLHVR